MAVSGSKYWSSKREIEMQTNTQTPTYTIEKNVPAPAPAYGGRGAVPKFPFGQMEVGDSVVIPVKSRSAAYAFAQKHSMRLTCRVEDTDTVRVWRIA